MESTLFEEWKSCRITSVSNYISLQKSQDLDPALYPERNSKKKVNYYVFEVVLEKYVKNGIEKSYTRATRVDKNDHVSDIYAKLISSGEH